MTSISAGHIILTQTQLVGSGRPQRESNPGPPHQESRDIPTELPRPLIITSVSVKVHRVSDSILFLGVQLSNGIKEQAIKRWLVRKYQHF